MLQKTLYFPEVGPAWQDWSIIVNVGKERARVTLIAHEDGTGEPVTTMEHELNPFECWTPRMEDIKVKSSIIIRCDQPIVAERHMHNDTAVIDLPGLQRKGDMLDFDILPRGCKWCQRLVPVSKCRRS